MEIHIHIRDTKFQNNIATASLLHFEIQSAEYNILIDNNPENAEIQSQFKNNLCNEKLISIVYPSVNLISEGYQTLTIDGRT